MGQHSAGRSRKGGDEPGAYAPGAGWTEYTAGSARRRRRVIRAVIISFVVFALLVVGGVIGAYAWFKGKERQFTAKNAKANAVVAPVLAKPKPPGNPFYMVLMGQDARPGEQVSNADTLMVAYVDPPQKRISLLSIPRDTRVHISGHGTKKINAAALLGGPKLTIETIKELTGLPITHYMVVDFTGFKDLVDAIGGVYVNVPYEIKDPQAANHDWRAEVIPAGYQKLDGAHALTFVRARHQFADQDLQRVKDQQIFLKALAKQTMQPANILKLPQITDALMRNVTTDMSAEQLLSLAGDMKGMGNGAVDSATMPGSSTYIGGVSYVIPDQAALAEMLQRVESGGTLTTPAVEATGTAASPNAPAASSFTVAVRNGTTHGGLAAAVATLLKNGGIRVGEVGTAASPKYASTLIVYRTDRAAAELVRAKLGFGTVLKSSSYRMTTPVLVVVGKDCPASVSAAK